MTTLFDPITIGSIEAKNRIVLAPITRSKATSEGVPTDSMAMYYRQRASVGLIASEATSISLDSHCLPNSPGIWSSEHVQGWKKVTSAVHEVGGKIVCQLWHPGRAAHSAFNGVHPISASETKFNGHINTPSGEKEPELARPASEEDITRIVEEFKQGAENAMAAGFDGVQVHCANGYLIGQFMCSNSNLRTDRYGGNVENRLRFFKEVVSVVSNTVGPSRTGVRFSPDIDPVDEETFVAASSFLEEHRIAFIGLREHSPLGPLIPPTVSYKNRLDLHDPIRNVYKGALIMNRDYTLEMAMEAIQTAIADAVSVGRPAMASRHLVAKMQATRPIRHFSDSVKYWYHEPEGYVVLPDLMPEVSA